MLAVYYTIFISSLLAEIFGFGLVTRYHSHQMYDMIAATNHELFFVIIYVIFFIVLPICSAIALHKARYYLLDRDKTDRIVVR